MRRVVFARFGNSTNADSALAGVREHKSVGPDLRVLVHRRAAGWKLDEQVQHSDSLAETDGRHGFVVGVIAGLVAGSACGAGLFAVLFGTTTIMLMTGMGLGALMGVLAGMLMSGIFGTGLTDNHLSKLAKNLGDDEVIVTFQTPNQEAARLVESVVREHGGRFTEKSSA